ncbi:MAG: glycoside hydrolase family 28 protein [Lachnospiraceae bacterium]|nr:glycoside hydrolase family 28 protein [Lachnospiraceae bacterium]
MKTELLWVSARCAVIEVKDCGYYESDIPHKVFVNGESKFETKKNIVTVDALLPNSEYDIAIEHDGEKSVVKVVTKEEYVTLDVKAFGAKGDGVNNDTAFIQTAIMACPKNGRVLIPAGTYKVTPIFLKSDMTLEIAEGAVIEAYTDRNMFPILPGQIECNDKEKEYLLGTWEGNPEDTFASVITGINLENVTITGKGTIDGQAGRDNWWDNPKVKRIAWRPRMIFLNNCKNVTVHGITVKNSPSWNVHPYFCENLHFYDMNIIGPKDSPNTDGLNPESCKNVDIIGVYFSVGDDCIAIKSGKIYMGAKYKTPSENLYIHQCCMRDGHGSIVIGSEMAGGVKELKVSECLFIHTDRGLRIKTRRGRGKDGIIDGIVFENIIMDNVLVPIVFNMFYFCDPDGHSEYVQSKEMYPVDERTPYLGSFLFKNIEAKNCHAAAAYMYGLPEQKIGEVTFENVSVTYAEDKEEFVPAMMDGAEKVTGVGIFAKNMKKLTLKNVTIEGQTGDAIIACDVDELVD